MVSSPFFFYGNFARTRTLTFFMDFNTAHRHERDSRIAFDADSHVYTVGGRELRSVTTVVSDNFEKFDADYWALRKAPSLGMTPEDVKDMWRRNGEAAAAKGTAMHAGIEQYYLDQTMPDNDTADLFRQFVALHQLHPYRTEWAIFDEGYKVAGTLDFLDCTDGVFTIYDWKRSNKILDASGSPIISSRFDKYAAEPISHIPDTTYCHYALQVSIYRHLLEKNYGLQIRGCRLGIFHPAYSQPYVLDMPDLREEAIAVLEANARQF